MPKKLENPEQIRTEKCYVRPGRQRIRTFDAGSAARIAVLAQKSGDSSELIFAKIAVKLGFGRYICEFLKALNPLYSAVTALSRVAGALAVTKLLDFLLQVFASGAYKKLPRVNVIGIVVVLIIAFLEDLVKSVQEILKSVDILKEGIDRLQLVCDIIKQLEEE